MALNLNKQQKEAVEFVNGPCIVMAVPGAGKTGCLIERLVYLIEHGVPQNNLLCLTFTNKAANEMKERICKRLGIEKDNLNFYIGTFHALCVRFLRKLNPLVEKSANFTIIDDREQVDAMSMVARHAGYEVKPSEIYFIINAVNKYRDQMEEEAVLNDRLKDDIYIDIAHKYIAHCDDNNIYDFSGLIYNCIKIIESHDEVRGKIQHTFKYIMVDETQDTNKAQFHLVNLLGGKWHNIMLIGDLDQCIVEGEKVLTSDGLKNIEEITKEDRIIACSGGGDTIDADIDNIYKKHVENYDIIEVTTKRGKTLKMSKEHIIFADYTRGSAKKIVVYLMYNKKLGYRVGVTNTKRKYGSIGQGIGARLNQERSDAIWILKAVDTVEEAKYWEEYYSVTYGIPTWCFYAKGRGLDYSEENIEKLFSSIDTVKNAEKLMDDLLIFKDRPHHVPKCMNASSRRNFTINMCVDSRHGTMHRYAISGADNSDREALSKLGLDVRNAGKGRRGWRVESAFISLDKIYEILESVQKYFEVNVIEKARLSDESLSLIPASHLREDMGIYVEENGKIAIDYVKKIEYKKYTGYLYDIDVNRYHNFITNGIASHNSIYGWRGARYQNILDFKDKYSDCEEISLSKNYRSTPQIVEHASKLIKHNASHLDTNFETDNPSGEPVRYLAFRDPQRESEWIATQIGKLMKEGGWDPEDIAILYRMNQMSEPIEQALTHIGIAYEVIGSRNFYDRKEVKDCLAMVKFLVNPKDGVSFHRITNLISDIGDVTIGKIEKRALENKISILEACRIEASNARATKIRRACQKICNIYDKDWMSLSASQSVSVLRESFEYDRYLLKEYGEACQERMDTLDQIITAVGEFNHKEDGLIQYINQISLMTASDKNSEQGKVSLMTIHSSKGLEFPIVFIIGVEDTILPNKRALEDDAFHGMEEERRLCYVGMTRAKKVLYMTCCQERKRHSNKGYFMNVKSKESPFMKECGLSAR